jgi:hypothetical protein
MSFLPHTLDAAQDRFVIPLWQLLLVCQLRLSRLLKPEGLLGKPQGGLCDHGAGRNIDTHDIALQKSRTVGPY